MHGSGVQPPVGLLARATALAETELLRLNAAEMIYRNKVYVHVFAMTSGSMDPARRCMKLYRRFAGFEIADIETTPSILHPIKLSIRYDFDLIGTRGEPAQRMNAALVRGVQQDRAFIVHRSESLLRQYLCNAEGEVVAMPPLPERPNIFNTPMAARFAEFALEEPALVPEGN